MEAINKRETADMRGGGRESEKNDIRQDGTQGKRGTAPEMTKNGVIHVARPGTGGRR